MNWLGYVFKAAELALSVLEVATPRRKGKPIDTGPTALELARDRMRARAKARLGK